MPTCAVGAVSRAEVDGSNLVGRAEINPEIIEIDRGPPSQKHDLHEAAPRRGARRCFVRWPEGIRNCECAEPLSTFELSIPPSRRVRRGVRLRICLDVGASVMCGIVRRKAG